MKHIIIINHICFYDCENLFRHLHKWSCQNDKPPDSEATCQRVRRYVRVVEHVHASIARSSARSLRIWLPGDSSADYHLDSIFIGAKIIVLLVIFTYITKLYIYIYISLYKYRSFHIDICIYPPQKKKKNICWWYPKWVCLKMGYLWLPCGSFGATPHSKTHRKIVSNIKSQYEPDVTINIPLSSH